MWSRVIWEEDNVEVEEVIPSHWVVDDAVLWPPNVTNLGAMRAITERWVPENTWIKYPLVRVKKSSDNKKDCETVNITCTEDTDEEDLGVFRKRIPKKKTFGSEFTTGGSSSEAANMDRRVPPRTISPPPRSPTPPDRSVPVGRRSRSSDRVGRRSRSRDRFGRRSRSSDRVGRRSRSSDRVGRRSRSRDRVGRRSRSSDRVGRCSRSSDRVGRCSRSRDHVGRRSRSRDRVGRRSRSSDRMAQRSMSMSRGGHHSRSSPIPRRSTFPMSEERFQRRVLYILAEIRDLMKKNQSNNNTEMRTMQMQQHDTMDSFSEFDNALKDREEYDICKATVAAIGGINMCDHTKKAMQRCMTNRIMSTMNFSGKKNKFPFGHTNFCRVIKDVMMSKYRSTEKEVSDSIVSKMGTRKKRWRRKKVAIGKLNYYFCEGRC
ncbi:serine/threonine-protein kinase fray2-like [Lingula anatina]|uniref:Serine/threonine-protein kinase fray2-like n=1 Tax=Lingula anatina TaxID=7574 RepID=A0A1S3IZ33_LINAN|nr:serine/threonine-protein kinase fray2-like [Lingula anatina]|eukprot:XP_013403246.1 serine/threonine-protein kinase fray2-like [Lingula anatina]